MLRIYGLTRIPVNIYPIISGCFNNRVIAVTSIAIKIIILISIKNGGIIKSSPFL